MVTIMQQLRDTQLGPTHISNYIRNTIKSVQTQNRYGNTPFIVGPYVLLIGYVGSLKYMCPMTRS